ncbi:MFS transporter [Brevibacillus choshinensis]
MYSWVFSIYMLTSTTSMPIYGKLADLYGRKRMYMFGAACSSWQSDLDC